MTKKWPYVVTDHQIILDTPIKGHAGRVLPYVRLLPNGRIIISKGYAWDGATWAPDFKWVMFPSLVHDAFYQLMREGEVAHRVKKEADELFYQLMIQRGAPKWLATMYYWAVKKLGGRGWINRQ
jgi:hypothetical protein